MTAAALKARGYEKAWVESGARQVVKKYGPRALSHQHVFIAGLTAGRPHWRKEALEDAKVIVRKEYPDLLPITTENLCKLFDALTEVDDEDS